MNEIKIIEGVGCYLDENNVVHLSLEDVSRGLGFTQTAKSGNEVIRWARVRGYIKEFGIPTSGDGTGKQSVSGRSTSGGSHRRYRNKHHGLQHYDRGRAKGTCQGTRIKRL